LVLLKIGRKEIKKENKLKLTFLILVKNNALDPDPGSRTVFIIVAVSGTIQNQ